MPPCSRVGTSPSPLWDNKQESFRGKEEGQQGKAPTEEPHVQRGKGMRTPEVLGAANACTGQEEKAPT